MATHFDQPHFMTPHMRQRNNLTPAEMVSKDADHQASFTGCSPCLQKAPQLIPSPDIHTAGPMPLAFSTKGKDGAFPQLFQETGEVWSDGQTPECPSLCRGSFFSNGALCAHTGNRQNPATSLHTFTWTVAVQEVFLPSMITLRSEGKGSLCKRL